MLYFESENELKFYNLEARSILFSFFFFMTTFIPSREVEKKLIRKVNKYISLHFAR